MKIQKSFQESHETYGAVRVCHDLRDEDERVGKNTVALLIRKAGLVPRPLRRFRITTDSRNTIASPNLLNRGFNVSKANRSWVSDITAIPTREGWLYLCVFMDLYSRAIVGWSMSGRIKGSLVTEALKMAVERRRPDHSVLVHSDQGAQYTSGEYQRTLKKHGMISSMSRRGNCWDNAVAESFFHSLKTERTHHEKYRNRAMAFLGVMAPSMMRRATEAFLLRKMMLEQLNLKIQNPVPGANKALGRSDSAAPPPPFLTP